MDHAEGQQHPIGIYLKVWGLLFVLSTLSYLVDYFQFHGYLRWSLIIVFMMLKAGLIVAVFMHLQWERLVLRCVVLVPPLAASRPGGADGIGIRLRPADAQHRRLTDGRERDE